MAKPIQVPVAEETQDARGSTKPSRKKKKKKKSKSKDKGSRKDSRSTEKTSRERKPREVVPVAAALPDPDPALPADPILAAILAEVKKVAAQVARLDARVAAMEAGPPPAAPAGNANAPAGAAPWRQAPYPRPWSNPSGKGGRSYPPRSGGLEGARAPGWNVTCWNCNRALRALLP